MVRRYFFRKAIRKGLGPRSPVGHTERTYRAFHNLLGGQQPLNCVIRDGKAGVVSGSASQFPCQNSDWLWVGSHSSLAACVVDFIMDNVYSISLSKRRLPDGQAYDCTSLDSWASLAHLPLNTIYARDPGPLWVVCQKQKEGQRVVHVGFWGNMSNSNKSQIQIQPPSQIPQSEAIKNNSTRQQNKLEKNSCIL